MAKNLSIVETRAANRPAYIRRPHPTPHKHSFTQPPALPRHPFPADPVLPSLVVHRLNFHTDGVLPCCKDGPAVEPRWGSGGTLPPGLVREQPEPALRRPGCGEALVRVRGQGGGDAPRDETGGKVLFSAKKRGKGVPGGGGGGCVWEADRPRQTRESVSCVWYIYTVSATARSNAKKLMGFWRLQWGVKRGK